MTAERLPTGRTLARWRVAGPLLTALRQPWVLFLLVFAVALSLRAIYLLEVRDSAFFLVLFVDPGMYHNWGREIAAGDWLSHSRPVFYLGPLYAYFLASIYSVTGPSPLSVAIVQSLLSALSAGLVAEIGRRLFDARVGLVAGLLAAAYAMYIFYSGIILGATLILFLNLSTILLVLEGMRRPRIWKWTLAGILFGLSACARGNILLFAPFVALSIVVATGPKRVRRWLPAVAAFALAALATVAPVTLHNWVIGGDRVLLTSNAGANFYIGNRIGADGIYMNAARYKGRSLGLSVREQKANFPAVAREVLGRDDLRPSEISAFWIGETLRQIREAPDRWFELLGDKLRYLVHAYEVPNNRNIYFSERFSWLLRQPLVTFGAILPLALVGMVVHAATWRRTLLLYGYVFSLAGALLAFFVNARYRLILTPALLLFASATLVWLFDALRRKRWWKAATAALACVALYPITYADVVRFNYQANYTNLGAAHRRLGDLDEALRWYDIAIGGNPGYAYAWYKKGQLLIDRKEYRRAETSLHEALRLARRSNNRVLVGRIQRQLGRIDRNRR